MVIVLINNFQNKQEEESGVRMYSLSWWYEIFHSEIRTQYSFVLPRVVCSTIGGQDDGWKEIDVTISILLSRVDSFHQNVFDLRCLIHEKISKAQLPWVRFWGAKIVVSSSTCPGLAQVMEVIIIDIRNHSQAHLWVITSNKWTYNSKIA